MTAVALVNMPFSSLARPSIGLSLLQAELRRASIPCDVHYLNLSFARLLGPSTYNLIAEQSPTTALLGEWLFSSSLFGPDPNRDREYLRAILRGQFRESFTSGTIREVLRARDLVPTYLSECVSNVRWDRYRIVGFSSMFQQNLASLALARELKNLYESMSLVIGGPNAEGDMGRALLEHFHFVDAVCSGEGDRSFIIYAERFLRNEDTTAIDGMLVRRGDGTIPTMAFSDAVRDLNALPYPDYQDYFDQLKATVAGEITGVTVPFETSRGCWWGAKQHCTFCGLNGTTMNYRSKSPDRALAEILDLGSRFGSQMLCVDNIFDLRYLHDLFPALADRNPGLSLFFESKVNLRREQIHVLRRAGVTILQPGIESLSSPILKLMRKGCSLLQVVQTLKWCSTEGIVVVWNLLYGFPGEEPSEYQSIANVIPSILHLQPPMATAPIRLDRFSPYFEEPETFGIRAVRPIQAYNFVYPFDTASIHQLAYYFDFSHPIKDAVNSYTAPVIAVVTEWQNRHSQVELRAEEEGEVLSVTDSRNIDSVFQYRFRGSERFVYQLCDEARHFDTILRHLGEEPVENRLGEEALSDLLEDFVRERLMIREGERFLSVATHIPPSMTNSGSPYTATSASKVASSDY